MTRAAFARSLHVPRATITYACKPGGLLADAFTGSGRDGRIDPSHPAAKSYAKRHEGNAPREDETPTRAGVGRPKKGDAASRDKERWAKVADKRSTTKTVEAVVADVRKPKRRSRTPVDNRTPEERAIDELGYIPVSIIEEKIHHLPEPIRAALDLTVRQVVTTYGLIPDFVEVLKAAKTIADIDNRRMLTAERRGDLIERDFVRVHIFGVIGASFTRLLSDSPRTITTRVRSLIESGETDEAVEVVIRSLMERQLRGLKETVSKALAKKRGAPDASEEFAA